MMRPARPLSIAVALLTLTGVDAQQFRSSTDVVSVFTTVQDQSTRLIPDLTRDDFIITDNGKEQPITFFSNEITPFSVVVMLDRSGSMVDHQIRIRDAAMAFIVRLLPDDQAQIGSFGDNPGNTVTLGPPAFTSNKDDLVAVLQQPIGPGGNSPVWLAINRAVTSLTEQVGRRIVVIFSDGRNEPAPAQFSVNVRDLIDRVRLANVMVYALAFSDAERRSGGVRIIPPDLELRRLADDSGGGYFEVTSADRLGPLFTRVAEELHRQYVLGFAPPQRDGRIHQIAVKVKRAGMTARARQTYVAPVK